MSNHRNTDNDIDGHRLFLRQFLRHPMRVASVAPSSRFLLRRIVAAGAIERAGLVVELGPGTGGTTRALLQALPKHGKLLAIEVDPCLHGAVSSIADPRLIAHRGSACDLLEILARHGLADADAVVSGIPFSTIGRSRGERIAAAIADSLAPDGRFVAYQASARVADLCRPHLGHPRVTTELRNIPPMRVFCWQRADN